MNNALRQLLLAVCVGAAAVGTNGCIKSPFSRTEAKEQNKGPEPVPVEVATIGRGPIQSLIRYSTHLEAESEVKVLARSANRVTDLLVEEGDQVERGAVLVRLEADIQKNQLAKAQSNLEKGSAEFARSQPLYDQNLISEQTFTDLKHQLRQYELALEDARRELEYTEVRAPIAGTVARRLVKVGDLVNLNQHLFDLVDFKSIVARVHIPDVELPRLSVDQAVRVRPLALPDREIAGHVRRVAPIIDSKTGLVAVTVAFRDVGPLLPGMYVDVEIVTDSREDALLLPKRALVYDGDQQFVYRLGTNRAVQRLVVEKRMENPLYVEPKTGFSEGDSIVIRGQTGLKDGAIVRLPSDPDPSTEEKKDQKREDVPATAKASEGNG